MAIHKVENAPTATQDHLSSLAAMLQQTPPTGAGTLKLVRSDGQEIEVPEMLLPLLRQLVGALANGKRVSVVTSSPELTTQQAADILNVSRPYMVRLLEEGKLPFTRTGKHRRILVADLLAYKQERDRHRREGLTEITRMGEEMGDYD